MQPQYPIYFKKLRVTPMGLAGFSVETAHVGGVGLHDAGIIHLDPSMAQVLTTLLIITAITLSLRLLPWVCGLGAMLADALIWALRRVNYALLMIAEFPDLIGVGVRKLYGLVAKGIKALGASVARGFSLVETWFDDASKAEGPPGE